MSAVLAAVLAAIITGGFGVLAAYVGRVEKHARAAVEQVKNSHTTNLRDDMDRMHADIREVLDSQTAILATQLAHGRELVRMRRDLINEQEDRQSADEALTEIISEIIDIK